MAPRPAKKDVTFGQTLGMVAMLCVGIVVVGGIAQAIFGPRSPAASQVAAAAPPTQTAVTVAAVAPSPAVPTVIPSTATPRPSPTPQPTATPQPSSTPVPTATPPPRIGSIVEGKNWGYRVNSVEKTKTLTWSQFGNATDAKGIWFVVYMTLRNSAKENFEINYHDFELHDGSGVKYNASADFSTISFARFKNVSSLGGQFPPGVPVESLVVYDIAPTAAGLKLWLVQEKIYVDLGQ